MAQTTIEQFATDLKMPAGALLEQLSAAGVAGKKQGDKLTEQDKTRLLDYLRKQHGAAGKPPDAARRPVPQHKHGARPGRHHVDVAGQQHVGRRAPAVEHEVVLVRTEKMFKVGPRSTK